MHLTLDGYRWLVIAVTNRSRGSRRSARGGRPVAGTELTPSNMAAATLDVIRDEGVEGLTRQQVAQRLNVSVRALYRLAPTADHLLADAVAEWQRRWQKPPHTGNWREDLRRWCVASRAHAAAFPGLTAAAQNLPPDLHQDETGPVVQAVVQCLSQAGFDTQTARLFFGVLSMHALGWAVVFPERRETSWTENGPHLQFREQGFELGLDLLLDGIASKLPS
ncbi:MAG: hypothetical protein AAGA48_03635 [Myxococcota bacterium]